MPEEARKEFPFSVSSPLAELLREYLSRVEREMEALLVTSDPFLAAALTDVLSRPAKRLRPLLGILGALATSGRVDRTVLRGAAAVEILHLASLVHDDIIDEAPSRGHRPTPHTFLGNHRAVLLGDFLFARALAGAGQIGRSCFRRFVEVAEALVTGEFFQNTMAGRLPRRDEYFQCLEAKTARLFALAASPGKNVVPALVRYGQALGMAYQLRDDLLDFIGREEEGGKPVGGDYRRGIYTYPLILLGELHPRWRRLLDRQDRAAFLEGERLKEILARTGMFKQTVEACRAWTRQAMAALEALSPTPAREALFALADWIGRIGGKKDA